MYWIFPWVAYFSSCKQWVIIILESVESLFLERCWNLPPNRKHLTRVSENESSDSSMKKKWHLNIFVLCSLDYRDSKFHEIQELPEGFILITWSAEYKMIRCILPQTSYPEIPAETCCLVLLGLVNSIFSSVFDKIRPHWSVLKSASVRGSVKHFGPDSNISTSWMCCHQGLWLSLKIICTAIIRLAFVVLSNSSYMAIWHVNKHEHGRFCLRSGNFSWRSPTPVGEWIIRGTSW